MVYTYHDTLGDEITTAACYGLDNPKTIYHYHYVSVHARANLIPEWERKGSRRIMNTILHRSLKNDILTDRIMIELLLTSS